MTANPRGKRTASGGHLPGAGGSAERALLTSPHLYSQRPRRLATFWATRVWLSCTPCSHPLTRGSYYTAPSTLSFGQSVSYR